MPTDQHSNGYTSLQKGTGTRGEHCKALSTATDASDFGYSSRDACVHTERIKVKVCIGDV